LSGNRWSLELLLVILILLVIRALFVDRPFRFLAERIVVLVASFVAFLLIAAFLLGGYPT
jgi:hypothetical protein